MHATALPAHRPRPSAREHGRRRSPGARSIAVLVALLLLVAPATVLAKKDKRIEALPQQYQEWLAVVGYLITDEELEAFLEIEKDYQRDAFIERFWRIRDPYPDTARNEFKDRWMTRLEEVIAEFGDLDEDRSRMLLLNGPPDGRLEFKCTTTTWPLEVWFYDGSERVLDEFYLIFVKRYGGKRFHLWRPVEGIGELLDNISAGNSGRDLYNRIRTCVDGDIVVKVLNILLQRPMDFEYLMARIEQPKEETSDEWLATFDTYSTELEEGVETLPATLDLEYPDRFQSRTVMSATISVDREKAVAGEIGGQSTYNFLISGELLREGKLFENFRYKYDFPAGATADVIPMTFERRLRPGPFTLIVKLEDINGKSAYREERDIEVPELGVQVRRAPKDAKSAEILADATAALEMGQNTVQIVAPRGEMQTGMVRFDTLTTGPEVAEMIFALDDGTEFRKRKPPFSVSLDLGRVPRHHVLRATALDAEGNELAVDEIELNAGQHRFGIRLVDPRQGVTYQSEARASAEVTVPTGGAVERVEFYRNEDLVATLYQPPFAQTIPLPEPGAIAYVRAVAYQPDGNSTEDLVFINAPDYLEEVEIEFVELYTTVLDKQNRPVLDLEQKDFSAFEDGVEQEIVRFELLDDLPVYAGVMLDVSASMEESIDRTRDAAMSFFEETITEKDRAALVLFNDHPLLAVEFTNERAEIAGGLAGIKAERGTSLYDSLIFTLYYFNGIKGQRALLLLSDGKDESSKFSFDDALEYARRTGVAIYSIGLDLTGKGSGEAKKELSRFADETGGRSFFIKSADELAAIYAAIQEELRSRYLIAYQSSHSGGEKGFREVAVEVAEKSLEAKTMSGYYP